MFDLFNSCLLYRKVAACYIVEPTLVRCKCADICNVTCPKYFEVTRMTDINRAIRVVKK
jgi:hypothetical protein